MFNLSLHASESEAAIFKLSGRFDHLSLNILNVVVHGLESSGELLHVLLHLSVVLAVTFDQLQRLFVLLRQIVEAGLRSFIVL